MDSIINKSDQFQLHNAQWGGLSYHDCCDNQPFALRYVHCFVICYGEKLKFKAGQVIVNMLSRRRYNISKDL